MSDIDWEAVAYEDPRLQVLLAEVQAEYVARYGGPDGPPSTRKASSRRRARSSSGCSTASRSPVALPAP